MKIEPNNIYLGDCLEGMKKIEDDSVDVIFTSPPYADRRKNSYEGHRHTVYNDWFVEIASEIKRVLKPTGSFFLNIKPHCEKGERLLYTYELVIRLRNEVGFKFVDEFSWTKSGVPGRFAGRFKNGFEPVYHFKKGDKVTFNPYEVAEPMKEESLARASRKASGESSNGSGFAGMRKNETMANKKLALPSNHLHISQKSNQFTLQSKHPAVFPIELPEFFIKAFSNKGDIVLDPFVGSGTTAIACLNTDRKYIGFELDETYHKLSLERIERHEVQIGWIK